MATEELHQCNWRDSSQSTTHSGFYMIVQSILLFLNSWVEQDLLPKLKSTSVLIMDNATFHKSKKLIELIKSAGHYIVWLPKYSTDLNPIEKMWSRVKSIRKKFRLKDIDELFRIYRDTLFNPNLG